jgi:hypothetical protein
MINLATIKIAGIIVGLVIYGWLAYDYGATSVKEDWNDAIAKLNASTAEALIAVNVRNSELQKQLSANQTNQAETIEIIKTQTVEVEKEVLKYVTKYRDTDCNAIDDDWVRIYNDSVRRTKAITTETK